MSTTTRVLSSATCLAVTATLATALAASPSTAAADPPWTVVANGLDNPRQLSFANGALYVAEAGTGGSGPCMTGPEGDDVCYGNTGAITRVTRHGQWRILKGLPSLAAPDGSAAIGPADVLVNRGRWTVSIGLGADPAVRSDLPWPGRTKTGTVLTGKFGHHRARILADLAAYEAAHDSDGLGPDSNPTGLTVLPAWRHKKSHGDRHGKHWHKAGLLATDSGANALMRISASGRIRTVKVFDSPGTVPAPFPPFDPIPMQPVPTSVAIGPDGAWYVSELTGFPFAPGASRIHRVTRNGHSSVFATGLTNVTDLAWRGNKLYAVQLSDVGLINEPALPMGSLVRVVPGGAPKTVVDDLPAPYGVAFNKKSAYITTCAVCADGGSVVKVAMK